MFGLEKPWFARNPRQIARRLWRAARPTSAAEVTVRLPWGPKLAVNPRETVGRAIWTTGIYDLAVSEALWRLTPPGARALDIGANLGYMTTLLATRAGAGGRVECFEPHPAVGERLGRNLAALAGPGVAPAALHAVAISDRAGTADFYLPAASAGNEGVGSLVASPGAGERVEVPTTALDALFPGESFAVAKLDVEGHEAAVLRGAARLLARRGVTHWVFEEHGGPSAEAFGLLRGAGYAVYQLGWTSAGPRLAALEAPSICSAYEAPNFLATADPTGAERELARPGWDIYSKRGGQ